MTGQNFRNRIFVVIEFNHAARDIVGTLKPVQ